jgi:hypothetical protein
LDVRGDDPQTCGRLAWGQWKSPGIVGRPSLLYDFGIRGARKGGDDMMRILAIGCAMVLAVAGTIPAHAQSDFEREVLRRLERLERRMDDLERRDDRRSDRDYSRSEDGQRNEVVAAVNQLCGGSCGMAAQTYCRGIGFRNGVALTIEKRGMFDHVTKARCFN